MEMKMIDKGRFAKFFEIGDGFRVLIYDEIVQGEECWAAVLFKEGYGVSYDMFGQPKKNEGNYTYDDFLDIVQGNLEEYIADFKEEMLEEYGDEI